MNNKPKLLVKVGKLVHLEELRKGKMFMRPLSFHRENEKKHPSSGVGDADEGLMMRVTKDMDLQLFVDGVAIEGVSMVQTFTNCSNPVFCCATANYELTEDQKVRVHFKNEYLSDFCLDNSVEYGFLLINQEVFLHRVALACKRQGIRFAAREVIYTDTQEPRLQEVDGQLVSPAFFKRTRFSHQNEFRLLFSNHVTDSFILDIGSIEDISEICQL